MNLSPTKTTNRIHFSDFDPIRFEEICFMLLNAMYTWHELIHIGRSGNDGGIDIKGTQLISSTKVNWLIQCKRYLKISNNDLKVMVDKLMQNQLRPDKILLIISCDLSKTKYDYINHYCKQLETPELIIWTATTLEAYLYAHPAILQIAIGADQQQNTKNNIAKLSRGLKMEKRLLKALIDEKFIKDPKNRETLMDYPGAKFISDEVYIRSVNDTTYGTGAITPKGTFNTSFKTYFYNTYHNGLEFWLGAGIGTDVIMDEGGFWEPILSSRDKRLGNPSYRVVPAKMIGRIPYHGIMDFKTDGDEYTSCPHLFCLFDYDGMPYEEIYFKSQGNKKAGTFDWDFDKTKRVTFPPID